MGIVDTTMAGRGEVTLSRPAPGSWGLRLQGGVDVQKALAIINVADGSPSEISGLKIGDILLQINGQDCSMMSHKAAQDAIVGSGDLVELLVQRWSAPAPAPQGVWKPGVQLVGTPATGPAPQGQTYTQTSLVAKPGGPTPRGPPQLQVCWLCSKPIMGVFLQIKGRPAHAECFVCSECKTSLRNVGHISVGEKMLCEACANNAMQAQATAAGTGPPQGLMGNLAMLAGRPHQGPATAPGLAQGLGNGIGGQPQVPQAGDWGRKLESDGAGSASNAEEFTKQFMQQLAGGH